MFFLTVVIVYAVALGFAFRIGSKENRAIRAGSKEAFDKRVNDLMRGQRYSLEKATAAVERIRDEKK